MNTEKITKNKPVKRTVKGESYYSDLAKRREDFRVALRVFCKNSGPAIQLRIAQHTGMTQQLISSIKTGITDKFGDKAMNRIADFFSIQLEDMLTYGKKISKGQAAPYPRGYKEKITPINNRIKRKTDK